MATWSRWNHSRSFQGHYLFFFYKSIAYMTTAHGTVTYITYRRKKKKKNYLQINYLHFLRDSYLHNLQKQRLITNQCLHY